MTQSEINKVADRRLLRKHKGQIITSAHGVVGIIQGINYRAASTLRNDQVSFLIETENERGHKLTHQSLENLDTFITKKDFNTNAIYYHAVIELKNLELC